LPTRTLLLIVTTQVLSNDIARRQVFVTTLYNAKLVTLSTSRYYSLISTWQKFVVAFTFSTLYTVSGRVDVSAVARPSFPPSGPCDRSSAV